MKKILITIALLIALTPIGLLIVLVWGIMIAAKTEYKPTKK